MHNTCSSDTAKQKQYDMDPRVNEKTPERREKVCPKIMKL